jgi:hypothetical protein
MRRAWLALGVGLAAWACGAGASWGQPQLPWVVDEARAELGKVDPGLVPWFEQGLAASDQGNRAESVVWFQRVNERAPDIPAVLLRWCVEESRRKRNAAALPLCERALELRGSARDHAVLSWMWMRSDKTQRANTKRARWHALRAWELAPNDIIGPLAACEVALNVVELPLLERCTDALVKLAPDRKQTWVYVAYKGLMAQDPWMAQEGLDRALELGLAYKEAALIQAQIDQMMPGWYLVVRELLGMWVNAGLGWLALVGLIAPLRRRSLWAAQGGRPLGKAAAWAQRALLWLACVYGVLTGWLVGLSGAAMAGVGLWAAWDTLGAGALAGASLLVGILGAQVVRAVSVRPRAYVPLTREAHPGLWASVEAEAARAGVDAPSEVLEGVGLEVRVLPRATVLEVMQGLGGRALVVGLEGWRADPTAWGARLAGVLALEGAEAHDAGGRLTRAVLARWEERLSWWEPVGLAWWARLPLAWWVGLLRWLGAGALAWQARGRLGR